MKNLLAGAALLLCAFLSLNFGDDKPASRWTHSMCYDTTNKVMLMFGGSGPNGFFGDLWGFSKGSWKKLADTGPSPRNKFAFAYDEKRKRAVLFGGSGANDELFSDTWEWDGTSWTKVNVTGPGPRNHPLAAFDPQSKTIILKGGFGNSGLLTDTWSFDGNRWTELSAAGTAGQGLAHGMFADQATQKLTLITVELNSTQDQPRLNNTWWVLNGNTWEPSRQDFPSTSRQSIQSISSFQKGGVMILDGDDINNNMPTTSWFLNGKWKSESLDGPAPRVGHCISWDPGEGGVILFGGYDRKTFFDDTWIWKNEKWIKR